MIQVEGLTKYYGEHAAIRDLTFKIEKGEVIGFLGLNGAGKTTTLRVLGCVLLPTSGRVEIDGIDIARDPHEIRKRIGFLPDVPPLYGEMTVGDYLSFVAQLRGVPSRDVKKRVAAVEEQTATTEVHEESIASLSHGYKQRVGLAQALVHNPALLILDEPTSGLDPVQIVEMRSLIRNLRGNHTVLLSSHILSEISQTCDRLLVINQGQITAQGTEQELAKQLGGGEAAEATELVEVDVAAIVEQATTLIRAVPGVKELDVIKNEQGVVTLRAKTALNVRPKIARALVGANLDLLRIDLSDAGLESVFLKLTKKGNA
jgi:ABC-2 type transport system ATP-binding protein